MNNSDDEAHSIPEKWQYAEKTEGFIWTPVKVITKGDSYLNLCDTFSRLINGGYLTSSAVEYFFDYEGQASFRRKRVLEAGQAYTYIDLAADFPLSLDIGEDPDEGQTLKHCYIDFYSPMRGRENLLELDYEDYGIIIWTSVFCPGFPDTNCPDVVFEGFLNESGYLQNFQDRELEEAYQREDWVVEKVDSDGLGTYRVMQSDIESFMVRIRLEPKNQSLILEQELIDPRFETRGVVKIMRSIIRPDLEAVIKLANLETKFDSETGVLLEAKWRDIQGLLGNPSLSYRGPLPRLLQEITRKYNDLQ